MSDHEAKAPDVLLAERIVRVLADRGLIRATDVDGVRETLVSGSTSQEDWRFWIEQKIADNMGEAANGQV